MPKGTPFLELPDRSAVPMIGALPGWPQTFGGRALYVAAPNYNYKKRTPLYKTETREIEAFIVADSEIEQR